MFDKKFVFSFLAATALASTLIQMPAYSGVWSEEDVDAERRCYYTLMRETYNKLSQDSQEFLELKQVAGKRSEALQQQANQLQEDLESRNEKREQVLKELAPYESKQKKLSARLTTLEKELEDKLDPYKKAILKRAQEFKGKEEKNAEDWEEPMYDDKETEDIRHAHKVEHRAKLAALTEEVEEAEYDNELLSKAFNEVKKDDEEKTSQRIKCLHQEIQKTSKVLDKEVEEMVDKRVLELISPASEESESLQQQVDQLRKGLESRKGKRTQMLTEERSKQNPLNKRLEALEYELEKKLEPYEKAIKKNREECEEATRSDPLIAMEYDELQKIPFKDRMVKDHRAYNARVAWATKSWEERIKKDEERKREIRAEHQNKIYKLEQERIRAKSAYNKLEEVLKGETEIDEQTTRLLKSINLGRKG